MICAASAACSTGRKLFHESKKCLKARTAGCESTSSLGSIINFLSAVELVVGVEQEASAAARAAFAASAILGRSPGMIDWLR